MTPSSNDNIIEQFVQFGGVGTQAARRQLVDALLYQLGHATPQAPPGPLPGLALFSKAIESILARGEILSASSSSATLARQIAIDILRWVKKTGQHVNRQNPYADQERLLLNARELPTSTRELLQAIEKIYSKREIDASFYQKKLEEPGTNRAVLHDDLVNTWETQLLARKRDFEEQEISASRDVFVATLGAKIEQFGKLKQLLEPFTADCTPLWDVSGGAWQKAGFELLEEHASMLESSGGIHDLAQLLGNYRQAEKELEEAVLKNSLRKPRWEVTNAAKSELVGLCESDDISSMLASETALLSDPLTNSIFFKKFADKKLQTFEFQSHFLDKSNDEESREHLREQDARRGPFVVCIDTSYSMQGAPEQVAKVLTFALMRIAVQEQRKCYLISFSDRIQTLDLASLPGSLQQLVHFLQMSFYGNTDATPAMRHTLALLDTEAFCKADVLVVSDFQMTDFDASTRRDIERAKFNRSRFFSLIISDNNNHADIPLFDATWVYNYRDRNATRQLAQQLHDFREHTDKRPAPSLVKPAEGNLDYYQI